MTTNNDQAQVLAWNRASTDERMRLITLARPNLNEKGREAHTKKAWDDLPKISRKSLNSIDWKPEEPSNDELADELEADVNSQTDQEVLQQQRDRYAKITKTQKITMNMEVFEEVDKTRTLSDGTDKHGYVIRAKTEDNAVLKLPFTSKAAAEAAGMYHHAKLKITIEAPDTLDDFIAASDAEEEDIEDGFVPGSDLLGEQSE